MFRQGKLIVGMVHLGPLPGSPRWGGDLDAVLRQAVTDACTLRDGGVDALLVENYGDRPFTGGRVDAATVAAMTRAVLAVRSTVDLPVGINVLRNDGHSALAIAAATGARFIRVNVYTGAMVAADGVLSGQAYELLRYRRSLGIDVQVWADVLVKHAWPLAIQSIEDAAYDAVDVGLADALIVSGSVTGQPAAVEDAVRVKRRLPEVPLLIGSGVQERNIRDYLRVADGVIVGTSLKVDGIVANPVDPERVRRLVRAVREAHDLF